MQRRSSEQEDYLLRLIRQAGEALARLRQRLRGGEQAPATVRHDVATAMQALLGAQASIVSAVDADTAVRLVGDRSVVAHWAALVELDAEAAAADGQREIAEARRMRSTALRTAALALWGPTEPPDDGGKSTPSTVQSTVDT